MLVYIWIQTVWHSDCIPETFFEKVGFEEKKSVDLKTKPYKIITQHAK